MTAEALTYLDLADAAEGGRLAVPESAKPEELEGLAEP
jgi:hypothetical protein